MTTIAPDVIESLETCVSAGIALATDVDLHGEKEYNTYIRNAPAQLRTAGGVSQMRRHHD